MWCAVHESLELRTLYGTLPCWGVPGQDSHAAEHHHYVCQEARTAANDCLCIGWHGNKLQTAKHCLRVVLFHFAIYSGYFTRRQDIWQSRMPGSKLPEGLNTGCWLWPLGGAWHPIRRGRRLGRPSTEPSTEIPASYIGILMPLQNSLVYSKDHKCELRSSFRALGEYCNHYRHHILHYTRLL